jgi:hypothetical protein
MARSSSTTQVQVTVAVIGVLGAVATATIANWDKIFPNPPPAKNEAAPAAADVAAIPAAPAKEVPNAAPRPRVAAAAEPDVEPDGDADIGGVWQDDFGVQYRIDQDSARYTFAGYQGGVQVVRGAGRIDGRVMRHSYETSNDAGECEGKVAEGDRLAFGRCVNVYQAVGPFRIRR